MKFTGTMSIFLSVLASTSGVFFGVVNGLLLGTIEGIFMRPFSHWDYLLLSHAFILSLSFWKGHADFFSGVSVSLSHFLCPHSFLLFTKNPRTAGSDGARPAQENVACRHSRDLLVGVLCPR
jgi:hypothetical protein